MTRIGRRGHHAAVATLSAATLLVGAAGAMAVGTPTAAAPTAPVAEAITSDTCQFPVQKLKVSVVLTLRSATDNDVKKIRVRASNKDETGSFYRKGVTLKRILIAVFHDSTGSTSSAFATSKKASPATLTLDPGSDGAEVRKVKTVTEFVLKNGSKATATCTINILDD